MSWGAIGAAAVGAISSNVQANKAKNAAKDTARIQSQQAEQQAADTRAAGERALGFFQPFQNIGERGASLSSFLADPNQQAQFAQQSPLFDLSRRLMTEDINQNAAARGRLSAGDTLERLQLAGVQAAQPLIDRQRQDILNLLNIGGSVAGNQAGTVMDTQRLITDLLTGGAAAEAAGTVSAANATNQNIGNLGGIAQGLFNSNLDFSGAFGGGGGSSVGGFSNAPIGPME